VPAESPGELELLERVLREDPEARAARRANERWVTAQRLWVAIDRAAITDDGDRARFIASRLWPDMPRPWIDALVARTRQQARDGHPLRRPERAEDVVGPSLALLMRQHRYRTITG